MKEHNGKVFVEGKTHDINELLEIIEILSYVIVFMFLISYRLLQLPTIAIILHNQQL